MKLAQLVQLINGNSDIRIIDKYDYVVAGVKDGIPACWNDSEVTDIRNNDGVLEITIDEVDNLAALENIQEALIDIRRKVLDGGAETPEVYNEELANFLGCLGEIVDNTRKALDEGKDWDVYLD